MTPESYIEEIENHEIIGKITQEAQRAYEDFLMASCWGICSDAAKKKETHAVGFKFL
jgi:hypothetical protein